jgi:hypothetical protein
MRFSVLAIACLLAGCPAKEETPVSKSAPPPAPPAAPASQPSSAPAYAAESAKPITGLVKVGDVKSDVMKPTDVLFVMVRQSQGGKLGRLIAVQRFANVQFPQRFEIGPGDVMVPGVPFEGPFIVMARLDHDGDPMTRKQEDLYALVSGEVQAGAENLELVLQTSTSGDYETAPPPAGPANPPPAAPSSQPK